MIRTFCLSLPDNEAPGRTQAAMKHFRSANPPLNDFQFFYGLHAEKAGLSTVHPYEIDNPGSGFRMGYKPTGIWLSHVMLWSALMLVHEDYFFILEDDAKFPDGWHARFVQALQDVPRDFDMLYVGNCCCKGAPTTHIKGEVFDVRYPQCTHAYVIAKKALPVLLANTRKCWAPIDLALKLEILPLLKAYTVLPSIFSQFNTEIPE
jgi:GR25 family glycosyltransferase involved in LPS biosynthesis